jgi:hypothetical protein
MGNFPELLGSPTYFLTWSVLDLVSMQFRINYRKHVTSMKRGNVTVNYES